MDANVFLVVYGFTFGLVVGTACSGINQLMKTVRVAMDVSSD